MTIDMTAEEREQAMDILRTARDRFSGPNSLCKGTLYRELEDGTVQYCILGARTFGIVVPTYHVDLIVAKTLHGALPRRWRGRQVVDFNDDPATTLRMVRLLLGRALRWLQVQPVIR